MSAHVKGWTKYNQLVNSKVDRLQQAKTSVFKYHTQLHVLKSYEKQRSMKSVLKVTESIYLQILTLISIPCMRKGRTGRGAEGVLLP